MHGNVGVNSPSAVSVNAGDLIVVFWSGVSGGTGSFTCSDTQGNTYGNAVSINSDRPSTQSIRAAVASSTSSVTVTASPSGVSTEVVHVAVFRHDGGSAPGTINASNSAISTGSTTVTTSVSDCLLVGFGDASSANDEGSGFTALWKDVSSVRVTSEYKLTSSSGANTVNLINGTPHRSIVGVAYDPPGAVAAKAFPFAASRPLAALLAM